MGKQIMCRKDWRRCSTRLHPVAVRRGQVRAACERGGDTCAPVHQGHVPPPKPAFLPWWAPHLHWPGLGQAIVDELPPGGVALPRCSQARGTGPARR